MNTLKYHHLFNVNPEEDAPGNLLQDKATPGRRYAASGQPGYAPPPAQERHEHKTDTTLPAFQRQTHHGSQTRPGHQATGYLTAAEFAEVERMRATGTNQVSRSAVVTKLLRIGLAVALDNHHATMLEPRIEQTMTRLHEAFVNRFMRVVAQTYYAAKAGDVKLTDLMSLAYGDNTAEFHKKIADAEKEARVSLVRHTAQQHPSGNGMRKAPQTGEERP